MILRKPYAFIIKHFKLIHLIILGCLFFSLYNLSGIGNLTNTLLVSQTYTYAGADVYINKSVYLFLFVALFLSSILFWLLKEKKKPVGLYFGLIVYIIFDIIMYFYFYGVLNDLMTKQLEIDTLTFVRDMIVIIRIASYVFMGLCFVRGIGFNIKQFNFSKDIEELKIAETDSEEYELMVGQNSYKYIRAIRRTLREAKYYIMENKFSIMILVAIVGLVLAYSGYKFYKQFVQTIKAREVSVVNGVSYVVNNAYITAENHKGEVIKKGSKFVVIDMSFNNTTDDKKVLDIDSFRLYNKQLHYNATQTYNSSFFDLGTPYERDTEIPSDTMMNRFIVFEIPSTVRTTKFVLRYEYGISSKKDKIFTNYIKFDINANNIDTDDNKAVIKLDENINSNVNSENKIDLAIKKYGVSENYSEKYTLCNRNLVCNNYNIVVSANSSNKKTMLVLDIKGLIYEDAKFTRRYSNFNDIFREFAKIQFTYGGTIVEEPAEIVPRSDIEDKIFCLVDREILNATSIKVILNFRNNTYIIPLFG